MIVIDLDQTLLRCNSFPKWISFLLKKSISTVRLDLFLTIGIFSLLRLLRFISHSTYKRKISSLPIPKDWNETFSKELTGHFQNSVIDYVKTIYKSNPSLKLILSTAAPANYVEPLSKYFPFSFHQVFASSFKEDSFIDHAGLNKAISFTQAYGDIQCELFITDHHTDIPMMKLSNKVMLVNPSHATLRMLEANDIKFEQLLIENHDH